VFSYPSKKLPLVALSGYKKSLSKSRGFPLLSRLKKQFIRQIVSSTIKCIPKIQYFSFIYTNANYFRSRRLYLTIHQSNPSIRFPYRKAGTEKPHFTEIIQTTHKNTVVVAPTGIAALNAGGLRFTPCFNCRLRIYSR
jgi:hypothetical protein